MIDATQAGGDGATERAALHASFVQRYEAAHGVVWGVVKEARLEDEEAVVAEVWARAWARYAEEVRKDEERQRAGQAPFQWDGWFRKIARNLVIDCQRREAVARRKVGKRLEAGSAGEGGQERSGKVRASVEAAYSATRPRAEVRDAEPERGFAWRDLCGALAAGVGKLPALEQQVLGYLAEGESDGEVGARLGVSAATARRIRTRALDTLRVTLVAQGYDGAAVVHARGGVGSRPRDRRLN